jgi:hypothetical protein
VSAHEALSAGDDPAGPRAAGDDYADFRGPALRYSVGPREGADVEILVRLERQPTTEEATSLEQAISAWDQHGVVNGFGRAPFWGRPGHLRGLYTDDRSGARWTDRTLSWLADFGSADARTAMDDLARRLAGWSVAHGVNIRELRFD